MSFQKTDILQEVVGGEEDWAANAKLLAGVGVHFGDVAPGQNDRTQGEKQASSTSASSGSGTGQRVLKKQKNDDGEAKVEPRCLFPGEETVSDERMRAAQAAAAAGAQDGQPALQPPPPPQALEVDFWDKPGGMLDFKIDRLGGQFAHSLNHMENELTANIEMETTMRKEESKHVADKVEDIVGRLKKLEMQQSSAPTTGAGASQGWKSQHIIIGCWGEGTTREQMATQATEFLKNFEGRDRLLVPCSPRPFGCIVKAKYMENMLTGTAWQLQKLMEGRTAPPKWAMVERSPEAGAHRRAVRDAVEAARTVTGQQAVVGGTGTIWYGGKEA